MWQLRISQFPPDIPSLALLFCTIHHKWILVNVSIDVCIQSHSSFQSLEQNNDLQLLFYEFSGTLISHETKGWEVNLSMVQVRQAIGTTVNQQLGGQILHWGSKR